MPEPLKRAAPVVIALALFIAALEVLRLELRAASWHELTADIVSVPGPQLLRAAMMTIASYVVLTGYDFLAFAYLGKRLSRRRIFATSFLAYAISNNVGLSMLSGASVRYRFYTRWGVTTAELSRVVVSYTVTFWLGLLLLGGLSLVLDPAAAARAVLSTGVVMTIGVLLMLIPLAYLLATVVRRTPLRIRAFELPLPSLRIATAQLGLSTIDWMLTGAVLYMLLPPGAVPFVAFLGAFLVAILLGMASHVPGGVGVFEGLMVLLLKPYLLSADLLPSLFVFRAIYYLAPLAVAIVGLVFDEAWQQRAHVSRLTSAAGRLAEQVTPALLAMLTFLAGVVLLFSSATPAAPGRLAWLERVLPLGVIETSHFLGSVIGTLLLILSQGLTRRLDGAFYLTVVAIGGGMATSLLKGADYEEAAILLAVLLVLWRARPAFNRKAALLDTSFSTSWIAAIVGAVAASIWLGLFAFQHVSYSHELWWRFEISGEASRFLRASVGGIMALGLLGFSRLVGYAPHNAPLPSDADLADAGRIIATQSSTFPYLVYLRDKAVLFNETRTVFIMYAVQGRTWVALGDPVGRAESAPEVVRLFLERCDDYGGVPVFYEVGSSRLHLYADFGLTFVKLGEEATVDLARFSLAGPHGGRHRQALRRLEKDGGTFRVLPPDQVPSVLDQLREISDDWLTAKSAAEKGFSLGFFDETYVARFPVALIEGKGRILAFATMWPGAGQQQLSVDLMRYHRDAPRSVMEALFIHMMQWGQQQGYREFALGMAPLSGFERSPTASLWNRLGAFLYEHGDALYNFQGLRAYKDKFDPEWTPHYLAYPGGLRLPRILADVAALIAGSYRHIFQK